MAVNSVATRLTGLTSGMDTDSLVQNLMKTQKLRLDRELRAKTTIEWKQAALSGISNDFKEFKQSFMSVLSPKNIYSSAAFKVFEVETANNTKNAVTATATASAAAGRVAINEIRQLAQAATASSGADVASVGTLDLNSTLGTANFSTPLAFEDGEISFAINGKEFTFGAGATMNDVIKKVNSDPTAGVTMKYSELTKKLTVSSNVMGESGRLDIVNYKGNAFGNGTTAGAFGIDVGQYQNGQDAIVMFDDGYGNNVEVRKNSNAFTLDGISYTLNRATLPTDGPIDITVKKNVDAVVDKVKGFVDGYNTLVKKLESMLSERKTNTEKKYTPLTDEEKAALSEKQVEDWEKIAKKGLLYNDAGLRSVVNSLRGALFEAVEGVGLSPAQIGLKTGSYFEGTKGQISLDEDALRTALEQDADKVMRVFTDQSSSTDPATANRQNGLLNRISGIMDNYTKGSQSVTLASMSRSLTALDNKISDMEDKMVEMEEKYYLKFAAMEQALTNMQSQTNWIAGMMGSQTK